MVKPASPKREKDVQVAHPLPKKEKPKREKGPFCPSCGVGGGMHSDIWCAATAGR